MASPASQLTQVLKTLWRRRAMVLILVLYTFACVLMTRRIAEGGSREVQLTRTASSEDRGLDDKLSNLHSFSKSLSAGYPAEPLGDTSRSSSGNKEGEAGAEFGTCPKVHVDLDSG
jgi:hypothetical protein